MDEDLKAKVEALEAEISGLKKKLLKEEKSTPPKEGEPQTFYLYFREEGGDRMISQGVWRWRTIPGCKVSIVNQSYTVKRISEHPKHKGAHIVWVEKA